MGSPSILHHTGLEWSGGATQVARLLIGGLAARSISTRLTFELAEKDDTTAILPEKFGSELAPDQVAHIHCTGNWSALLNSLPQSRQSVITLHDCELFTGGCPYPLGCSNIDEYCANPCPRKFPESETIRKEKHRLIGDLDPVLVAPSRWLARLAKAHLFRHVKVIPNGIPWPDKPPRKLEARKMLGINPAARVAMFVAHGGTGASYKSGQDWRRLWDQIKAKVPEALCFAVGGDTAGREGDLVTWPYVERHRLALLMSAADVLLYPTRADNHSLVVLEAMAQELCVLAYGVGGIPEQITHGATGVIVSPGDENEFLASATELLASPTLTRDYGKAAFLAGHKRFSAERMIADYIKLYERLG